MLLLTVAAFSDDPVRPANPQKQRVSPKLLREAMALPEIKARTQQVAPVSLADLGRLADKLKAKGDVEGAELLERFIREREQVVAEAVNPKVRNESYNVECNAIDVNVEELPANLVAVERNCALCTKELLAELLHLVIAKKAKAVIEHVLIPIQAHEKGRARSMADLPPRLPSSDGSTPSHLHEIGTVVETFVTPVSKDRIRIQITTETTSKDAEKLDPIGRPSFVPSDYSFVIETDQGITKRTIQSVVEANLGET
jgi:hypothetical protein